MKPRRIDEAAAVPKARPAPGDEVGDDELDSDAPSTVEAATAELAAGPAAGGPAPAGLAERDLRILDFERQWWKHAGAKEQAIRDQFGLSATRYYQVLNALLEQPAALAHDPVLVGRLRRLRASRSRRSSG